MAAANASTTQRRRVQPKRKTRPGQATFRAGAAEMDEMDKVYDSGDGDEAQDIDTHPRSRYVSFALPTYVMLVIITERNREDRECPRL